MNEMKNELIKALTAHSGNDNLIPQSLDYDIFDIIANVINLGKLNIKLPYKFGCLKITRDLPDYIFPLFKYINLLRITKTKNYYYILFSLKFIYNLKYKIDKYDFSNVPLYEFQVEKKYYKKSFKKLLKLLRILHLIKKPINEKIIKKKIIKTNLFHNFKTDNIIL
jgi:hypothetical protein